MEWFIDLIPSRYYIKFKNNKLIDWNIFHIQLVYTHNNIEDCPICVDSLISYASTPVYKSQGDDHWINTGFPRYVSETVLKEFFFYYLE